MPRPRGLSLCLIRSIPTEVTVMVQPFGVPRREFGTATAQNTQPIAATPADMGHPRAWKGPSADSPGHGQDGDVSPIQNHRTLLGLGPRGGEAAPWRPQGGASAAQGLVLRPVPPAQQEGCLFPGDVWPEALSSAGTLDAL